MSGVGFRARGLGGIRGGRQRVAFDTAKFFVDRFGFGVESGWNVRGAASVVHILEARTSTLES